MTGENIDSILARPSMEHIQPFGVVDVSHENKLALFHKALPTSREASYESKRDLSELEKLNPDEMMLNSMG